MAVVFNANVYGITGLGTKVKIGTSEHNDTEAFYVGGKIFYIDETVNNVYKFFDIHGDEITDIQVGDEPFAYKVIDRIVNKDKYYIANINEKRYQRWNYKTTDWVNYYFNGGNTVGDGRANTNLVVGENWDTPYITSDSANDGSNIPTIWYTVKQMRLNNENGCNDWYVPSRDEVEQLATATDRDGALVFPSAPDRRILSSTDSGTTHAKSWNTNAMGVYEKNGYITTVLGVRSF